MRTQFNGSLSRSTILRDVSVTKRQQQKQISFAGNGLLRGKKQ